MRHFPVREPGYAIGFIVVLAALYVGAYYAMVITRSQYLDRYMLSLKVSTKGPPIYRVAPEYRFGGDAAVRFFAPMHDIDTRLRPSIWEFSVK
jgi:hypothetical protein